MNDLTYFILSGLYHGYSTEAIHAYLMRRGDVETNMVNRFTPTGVGTQFEGMGFIPSERELAMTLEEVTSDVNSRRICSVPFPNDGPFDTEFEAYLDNPPDDTEDRVLAVLQYLKENTYESYLRANFERFQRGEVPAWGAPEAPAAPGIPGDGLERDGGSGSAEAGSDQAVTGDDQEEANGHRGDSGDEPSDRSPEEPS